MCVCVGIYIHMQLSPSAGFRVNSPNRSGRMGQRVGGGVAQPRIFLAKPATTTYAVTPRRDSNSAARAQIGGICVCHFSLYISIYLFYLYIGIYSYICMQAYVYIYAYVCVSVSTSDPSGGTPSSA